MQIGLLYGEMTGGGLKKGSHFV